MKVSPHVTQPSFYNEMLQGIKHTIKKEEFQISYQTS